MPQKEPWWRGGPDFTYAETITRDGIEFTVYHQQHAPLSEREMVAKLKSAHLSDTPENRKMAQDDAAYSVNVIEHDGKVVAHIGSFYGAPEHFSAWNKSGGPYGNMDDMVRNGAGQGGGSYDALLDRVLAHATPKLTKKAIRMKN